jgi:hypothetical protein
MKISCNTDDSLTKGSWITLVHTELVPLNIDYFWSAFDDYLDFFKGFSGRKDVEIEVDDNKQQNEPGAIVRFNFQGSLVRGRLLLNDRLNHVWRMDIPQATPLFTIYIVTFFAEKIAESLTEVSIKVEVVLQSDDHDEREQDLNTLLLHAPRLISEIVEFLKVRDSSDFELAPLGKEEVYNLASGFYEALDRHADANEYLQFIDTENVRFKMNFPNGVISSQDEFKDWYLDSIKVYFNEVHKLKQINSIMEIGDGRLSLDVIVHWEASTWVAPSAQSTRIVAEVQQNWVVTRSSNSYKPMFEEYIVNHVNRL